MTDGILVHHALEAISNLGLSDSITTVIIQHVAAPVVQAVAPVIAPVMPPSPPPTTIPTLQPETAPLWLDVFIWMALGWQWILIGFIPAFYIAVVKLFGMPLLQRWQQEVVIILYPNKVKFGKLKEQFEPYFKDGKGVYWPEESIAPKSYESSFDELNPRIQAKLLQLKTKHEELVKKEVKTKQDEKEMQRLMKQADRLLARGLDVRPINHIHVFTHAVNQEVTSLKRRETKLDEILNNNFNLRKLPGHGIWLLQNPRLHFHRHYLLTIYLDKTYTLKPVKDRQQFGIGFWHSLGVEQEKEVEVKQDENVDSESGGTVKQLIATTITSNVILEQRQVFQHDQNMSASRAFMLLQSRAKIENKYNGFEAMVSGKFDARILLFLAGMIGCVAVIFLFLHGGGTPGTAAPPGPKMIL